MKSFLRYKIKKYSEMAQNSKFVLNSCSTLVFQSLISFFAELSKWYLASDICSIKLTCDKIVVKMKTCGHFFFAELTLWFFVLNHVILFFTWAQWIQFDVKLSRKCNLWSAFFMELSKWYLARDICSIKLTCDEIVVKMKICGQFFSVGVYDICVLCFVYDCVLRR